MPFKLNYLAILVAVVANFILGFLWYMPLFGKIWGREMGYDPNEKPVTKVMVKGMVFMIIGNILLVWVIASNLAGWQFIPGVKEMGPFMNAINASIFLWLGFYFPVHLGATVWEKKSWTLFSINAGYHFISLLVISMILTHWKYSVD